MRTDYPVMWTSSHEKERKRWRKALIWTNLVWAIISLFLYQGWARVNKIDDQIFALNEQIREYRVRDEIFNILRTKGISLSQGIDIANALILHSRENKIPLELGLGIMKKESEFHVNAISERNAIGLMQLMPSTFDSYNKNLRLGLTRQAAFDPIINIKISMKHLRDIYEELKAGSKEKELWGRVLGAYSGGAKNYAKDVMRLTEEFKKKLERRDTDASSAS